MPIVPFRFHVFDLSPDINMTAGLITGLTKFWGKPFSAVLGFINIIIKSCYVECSAEATRCDIVIQSREYIIRRFFGAFTSIFHSSLSTSTSEYYYKNV
jgi:hypothetical protein